MVELTASLFGTWGCIPSSKWLITHGLRLIDGIYHMYILCIYIYIHILYIHYTHIYIYTYLYIIYIYIYIILYIIHIII